MIDLIVERSSVRGTLVTLADHYARARAPRPSSVIAPDVSANGVVTDAGAIFERGTILTGGAFEAEP